MSSNNGAKRVVIHEDDVGMSHGANTAFVELSKLGTCSSGSVMVPCPWFPEAAEIAAADPSLDVGVHLTLTSEQKPYRWRPLTAPPRSAGLTDEHGYFWPDVPRARKAAPEAVEAELRAQIEMALAAGIDPTHFDAHMGTAQMPEFVAISRKLGGGVPGADAAGEGSIRATIPRAMPGRSIPPATTPRSSRRGRPASRCSTSSTRRPGRGRPTPRPPTARSSPPSSRASPSCRCTSTSPATSRPSIPNGRISGRRNMRSSEPRRSRSGSSSSAST